MKIRKLTSFLLSVVTVFTLTMPAMAGGNGFFNYGTFNNLSGGSLNNQGAFENGGSFNNAGSILNNEGGTFSNTGRLMKRAGGIFSGLAEDILSAIIDGTDALTRGKSAAYLAETFGVWPYATTAYSGSYETSTPIPPDVIGTQYEKQIMYCIDQEWLSPVSSDTYGPDLPVTRAAAATILSRMLLGASAFDALSASESVFTDMPITAWYAAPVTFLASLGVYPSGGQFKPDEEIEVADFMDWADRLKPVASGTCGANGSSNVRWSLDAVGRMYVGGTGEMADYSINSSGGMAYGDYRPWEIFLSRITSVQIGSGVTTIGSGAFMLCTNLTSASLPSSLTDIGARAFNQCGSLSYITIPDSVTSIGNAAFWGCDSLTAVNIPASVTSIGDQTFSSCVKLSAITVGEDSSDFASAGGVLFDAGQTKLICYPAGKTDATYTVPPVVATIGFGAFQGCALSRITIPVSVTGIEEYAFNGCDALTTVNYEGTVEQWDGIGIASEGNEPLSNATIRCADGDTTVTYTRTETTVTENPDGSTITTVDRTRYAADGSNSETTTVTTYKNSDGRVTQAENTESMRTYSEDGEVYQSEKTVSRYEIDNGVAAETWRSSEIIDQTTSASDENRTSHSKETYTSGAVDSDGAYTAHFERTTDVDWTETYSDGSTKTHRETVRTVKERDDNGDMVVRKSGSYTVIYDGTSTYGENAGSSTWTSTTTYLDSRTYTESGNDSWDQAGSSSHSTGTGTDYTTKTDSTGTYTDDGYVDDWSSETNYTSGERYFSEQHEERTGDTGTISENRTDEYFYNDETVLKQEYVYSGTVAYGTNRTTTTWTDTTTFYRDGVKLYEYPQSGTTVVTWVDNDDGTAVMTTVKTYTYTDADGIERTNTETTTRTTTVTSDDPSYTGGGYATPAPASGGGTAYVNYDEITGALTAISTSDNSVTVDGEKYFYSNSYSGEKLDATALNHYVTLYLVNGYIIGHSVGESADIGGPYAVSFLTAGATACAPQTVNAGEKATKPADPTWEGYTFGGWYTDSDLENEYDFDTLVTSDLTLYAKWEPNTYTVTLNTDGGTINSGSVTGYTYGDGASLPTDVTKANYTFGGWYDNSGLTGTAVTSIGATDTGNKEYWAKWTAVGGASNVLSNNVVYAISGSEESATLTISVDNSISLTDESKSGMIEEYTGSGANSLWSDQAKAITQLVVNDGVKTIGACVFKSLSNLESVSLASSVTTIDNSAFADCTSLSSITLPGVTIIGGNAFAGCTSLQQVTLQSRLIGISAGAFATNAPETVSMSVSHTLASTSALENWKTLDIGSAVFPTNTTITLGESSDTANPTITIVSGTIT